MFARLTRHITKVHKNDERVIKALDLPKHEKNRMFSVFKAEGINQYNEEQIQKDNPIYARERKARVCDKLVKCSHCNRFLSKSFYTRHKRKCTADTGRCSSVCAIPVEDFKDPPVAVKESFKADVLSNMRDDEVGLLVKKDPIILMIGSRLFGVVKRRFNKKDEVINKIRTDMRRLGHLYTRFKSMNPTKTSSKDSSDMFLCENFKALEDAIDDFTDTNAETQKAGLKNQLYYLLLKSAGKLIAHYMISKETSLKKEVEDFVILLKYRKDDVFGNAIYDLNERRNINLKKPSALPLESDINLVKTHALEVMEKYQKDPFHKWDLHSFKELRDCVCTRLTMYNGRRGGEPARLLVREWKEALNGSWLDEQRTVENSAESLITYQNGKGFLYFFYSVLFFTVQVHY